MSIASVNVKVGAEIKEFQRNMALVSKQFAEVGQKLQQTSNMIRNAVSLPFAAASVAGAKFASETQAELIKINTLVGITGTAFSDMRKAVESVSDATGQGRTEIAQAAFAIYSAGLRGKEALDLLNQSAKATTIGLGAQNDVARAATAVMQAYGSENMSASKAVDLLTGIVREGNLEASELAPAIGKVIPIAASLGVTFEEVGANIAVFTRLGISAAEAVTSLKAVLAGILKPTQEAQEELGKYGLTFDDLRNKLKSEGLAAVLQQMMALTNGNVESLGRMMPSVEGLANALGTAGAQAASYTDVLANLQNVQGIVNDGFRTAAQGDLLTYQKTMNDLKNLTMEIGQIMMPVFQKVAEVVRNVAASFRSLSDEQKETAVKITALVAASPILLSALSGIATMASTAASVISKVLVPAFASLSLAQAPLLAGALAIGGALAVMAYGWDIVQNSISAISIDLAYFWETNEKIRQSVIGIGQGFIAMREIAVFSLKTAIQETQLFFTALSLLKAGQADASMAIFNLMGNVASTNWKATLDKMDADMAAWMVKVQNYKMPFLLPDDIKNPLDLLKQSFDDLMAPITNLFKGANNPLAVIENSAVSATTAVKSLNTEMTKLGEISKTLTQWKPALVELEGDIDDWSKRWKEVLSDMERSTEMAFSNMLGDTIMGFTQSLSGMTSIEDVFRNINNQLANLLENLGKTAIYKGLIEGALSKLFLSPYASIAAGVAALTFAGALRGSAERRAQGMGGIPAFANGGLVTGPMLAMVGDNPNARRDPEAILPVSKLKGMIADAGGGSQQLYGRLSGTDIYISNDRTAYRLNRTSGRGRS